MSLTHNTFIKTKLVGVLGSSFLRAGVTLVDGKRLGAAKRLDLAKEEGFVAVRQTKKLTDEGVIVPKPDEQVTDFLRGKGHTVVAERSTYGQHYYDYKNRLENTPRHKEKTDLHRHNMAMRYMVKQFLADLHIKWRELEGLPVSTRYSEGKLGIVHGKAKAA